MEKKEFNIILALGIVLVASIGVSTWFLLNEIQSVDAKVTNTETGVAENKGLIQGVSSEIELVKQDTSSKLDKLNDDVTQQRSSITELQEEVGIQITQLGEQNTALQTQQAQQQQQLVELEQKEANELANIDNAKKSVIVLTYTIKEQDGSSTETYSSLCSGVIYKQNGNTLSAVTNQHCVDWRYLGWANYDSSEAGDPEIVSEVLEASTINGAKHTVTSVVKAPDSVDLAIITFTKNDGEPFAAATYINSLPSVGADVVAIGSPSGLSYTTTKGIVSAFREGIYENGRSVMLVQTDAAINPGNSGGGLFRLSDGALVGINTFIFGNTEGLNFAISSKSFIEVMSP
jgi:S1-C subfamily serine protease